MRRSAEAGARWFSGWPQPRTRPGGCRPLQQRARGLQVLAQLVHLGAGLGIFGAHLVHQASKLADLILQVTNRACRFPRRREAAGAGASCARLIEVDKTKAATASAAPRIAGVFRLFTPSSYTFQGSGTGEETHCA